MTRLCLVRTVSATVGLAVSAAGLAIPARGGDAGPAALRPGAYSVAFRLELPHLENVTQSREAAICVVSAEVDGTQGLGAISDNNPLARCAAAAVRDDGAGSLRFDIVCAGGNAARGEAAFRLHGDRFSGRIAMKMGGKNMTMTETQEGVRTGDCGAPALGKPGRTGKALLQHQN